MLNDLLQVTCNKEFEFQFIIMRKVCRTHYNCTIFAGNGMVEHIAQLTTPVNK